MAADPDGRGPISTNFRTCRKHASPSRMAGVWPQPKSGRTRAIRARSGGRGTAPMLGARAPEGKLAPDFRPRHSAPVAGFDWLVWMNGLGCMGGGVLPIVWSRPGEPGTAVHGFAAGTLLGAGLLVLIPGAIPVLGAKVGISVLAGFALLYLIDRLLVGGEVGHGEEHAEAGHAHHM